MQLFDIPPWDQLPYFEQPVEGVVAVASDNVPLVKGDPNRRTLIFQLIPGAAGTLLVSTSPNANHTMGMVLNSTQPLILGFDAVGPIVCGPWFGSVIPPGGGSIAFLSQSMITWPDANGRHNLMKGYGNGLLANGNGRANGNGVQSGQYANRGLQSPEAEADYLKSLIERYQCQPDWPSNGNGWIPPARWRRPSYP